MKIIKMSIIGFSAALLAACGDPTINTSSEKAMIESVKEMTAEMTMAERQKVGAAFMKVAMSGKEGEYLEEMDGMTAEEIIDFTENLD
jgi:hypothetical protein